MTNAKRFLVALLIAFVAVSDPLRAQEKEKEDAPKASTAERVSKVFEVKYADPNRVANLIDIFGAAVHRDADLRAITVSGSASAVAAIEEAIKKLDVPPPPEKDIDLTVYLLVASRQLIEGGGASIPGELQGVVSQLKSVLNYQGFRLLNTLLMRTRDHEGARVTGVVAAGREGDHPASYDFSFKRARINSDGKNHTIRIDEMKLYLQGPSAPPAALLAEGKSMFQSNINTDVDVGEGQKVVVGKTTFDSPDNGLILVLTARVVD